MTKLFNRLSVRELILLLGVSVMGMWSMVGVMAQVDESGEVGMELQLFADSSGIQNPSCFDGYKN